MNILYFLGVEPADFSPGTWEDSEYKNDSSKCYLCKDTPRYFVNSGQQYLKRREKDIQDRFCLIAAVMPLAGIVVVVGHVALSILKVVCFKAFGDEEHPSRPWADDAKAWSVDLLRLLATPLSLLVAEGLAIYGMIYPKEGMKAWTTFGQVALGDKKDLFFNPFIQGGFGDSHTLDHLVTDIVPGDFCPWNQWKEDDNSNLDPKTGMPQLICDLTTKRLYFNDLSSRIRLKGAGLFFLTPILHPVTMSCNVVFRMFKLITFYSFWRGLGEEVPYNLQGRVQHWVGDLLRIAFAPMVLVGLCLSALYMVVNPMDGKKLYATLVRAEYGHYIVEPCLQPGYKPDHKLRDRID